MTCIQTPGFSKKPGVSSCATGSRAGGGQSHGKAEIAR